MSPIQHGFAPANVDLNLLEADQSFFDNAFPPHVSCSPLPFSTDSVSSSFAAAPTPAPDRYPLTTRQHSPLSKPEEHLFEHSTYDPTDLFLPTLENFTSDAVSETPLGLIVPPSTATAAAAIDPLSLALSPSSFELPSVTWAPSIPGSFAPAAFAPSAFDPVSFAPSQNLSVTPSTTTPGDDFANSQRPSDDVGLGEGWDLDSLATMSPANLVPEVDDVDTYAPPNFGTTQFPAREPLPTLPVLAAAPAPRHHPNSQQTAKRIAEQVTPQVTADVNGVPAKRRPGRPRLPEGAPKAPYKKRNVPAPPPTTSAKPKRAYKKRTAVTVD